MRPVGGEQGKGKGDIRRGWDGGQGVAGTEDGRVQGGGVKMSGRSVPTAQDAASRVERVVALEALEAVVALRVTICAGGV